MINLSNLVKLQALFAAASLTYLIASFARLQITGSPLSAAAIGPSIAMFVVYIACLFLPKNGQIGWYRIMMVVAIVFFGGGGVLGNIVRYLDGGAALYAGVGAWVVALAINAFGTVCNIIAALGLFRPSPREMN